VPFVRVEYLDFQNVAEHREFRLRVCGPHGSIEFRMRIAIEAFCAGRVRLQDGPDVCYQRLLRAVADGESMSLDAITIDELELASYRAIHTPAPRHRAWTSSTPPTPPATALKQRRTSPPPPHVVPFAPAGGVPALEEGQRVRHAVFGVGVTISASGHRTVVSFDLNGPKTFVTSMLKVEVLSAPRTWETTPRGKNRPCRSLAQPASSLD
jgi:hypothetical protein